VFTEPFPSNSHHFWLHCFGFQALGEYTDTQQGELISLLLVFKSKESRVSNSWEVRTPSIKVGSGPLGGGYDPQFEKLVYAVNVLRFPVSCSCSLYWIHRY
jgi:hypothetical protein